MTLLLVHSVLAVLLFLLVNWIGRHSAPFGYRTLSLYERVEEAPAFNLLFRVGAPQVYLVLAAASLSAAGLFHYAADLWRVTALYFGVRIGFNLIMGRAVLINWWTQVVLGAIATGISYWLSRSVLTSADRALPDPGDLTTELWLVVILFAYQTINQLSFGGSQQSARQERYVDRHFQRFRRKYGAIIQAEATDPWVEALAYAILVFEDFNRPAVARLFESYLLFPLGLARTLGPMQVAVDRRVSDAEGVRLGVQRIVSLYPAVEESIRKRYAEYINKEGDVSGYVRSRIGRHVAVQYNPDGKYADEVCGLYETILERYYPTLQRSSQPELG